MHLILSHDIDCYWLIVSKKNFTEPKKPYLILHHPDWCNLQLLLENVIKMDAITNEVTLMEDWEVVDIDDWMGGNQFWKESL